MTMKQRHAMKKLMNALFEELGMAAILPTGDRITVLFQAKDHAYTVSHSELMATTGLMEVRAADCAACHITPTVGLVLVIQDQAFKVINEPQFDAVSDCWQFTVMAQGNPTDKPAAPFNGKSWGKKSVEGNAES